ncbi:hypothetical protein [Streptomyces venezuelae]
MPDGLAVAMGADESVAWLMDLALRDVTGALDPRTPKGPEE